MDFPLPAIGGMLQVQRLREARDSEMQEEGADNNRLAGLLAQLQQDRLQLMVRCTAVLQHSDEQPKLLAALQQWPNTQRFDAGIFKRSDPAADHFLVTDVALGRLQARPPQPTLQHLLGQPSTHLPHHLS